MTRARHLARTRAIQRRRKEMRLAILLHALAQVALNAHYRRVVARMMPTYRSVGLTWW